jgi:cardiolipin synthase
VHAVPSFTKEESFIACNVRFALESDPGLLPRTSREFETEAGVLRSGWFLVKSFMSDVSNTRLNPLRTAPNLLTLGRICLAPFLVAAILDGHYGLSFGLFVVAGLTDALDGTLARILKQRTMLGSYLDPVADKLLLSTLFLVLMHQGLIPARVTVMVFGRDVGILLVAALLYAAVGRREFAPSIFGKGNTLVQVAAVAAVLLQQLTAAHWVAVVRMVALDATMVLTVVSGLHYAWIASRRVGIPAGGAPGAR